MLDYIRVAAQMAEKRIQDVITYISGLSGYTDLCPNDQYYLLKYGCSEILSLRRITYYNDKTKVFVQYMVLP
ncbi:unnamed protein product [Oppiella nova]|uniref:NR LBD domain-containing protein n=1 Tax=Oppiella nova TaxID=334625 RepID=A0A7R9LXN2_9ACAR|nr:unnamed protein product [Oppiella nova]CAG2167907.1 unnamed protein product [Oppiella nova]